MSVPEGTPARAVIFGCAGASLTDEEAEFFRAADPLGLILFARNCETPDQVAALVRSFRAIVGRRDAPVLIDQEGGRVARLGPPGWRHPPAGRVFADLARNNRTDAVRASYLNARLIGRELAAAGITVDCTPVLDLPVAGAHEIIGDRALGGDVDTITALGNAVCDGLLDEGVLPVIKHIPGHGRARADSHQSLPVVEAPLEELRRTDFATFKALSHRPWGMTAHVVYTVIDDARPATVSPVAISDVIRGEIGFAGVLLSDDIGMKALSGDFAGRAGLALAAGCDIALHCSGEIEEMKLIAAAVPPMTEQTTARLQYAEAMRLAGAARGKPDAQDMMAELSDLIGAVAGVLP